MLQFLSSHPTPFSPYSRSYSSPALKTGLIGDVAKENHEA